MRWKSAERGPAGPLCGLRVIELAGLGPGPFAAMVLADLGADVISVDRPSPNQPEERFRFDLLRRGRPSIVINLKDPAGADLLLRMVEDADVLIEGYRPGVVERLGIGPDVCLRRNPRLVYGRMTGWGQDGPYANQPGHDINYIAMAGALDPIGISGGPPVPPLNFVGDFGGGAMLLLVGVLAAIIEARQSGSGQVVDAAMVDGAALLTTPFHGFIAEGSWRPERGTNLLDGGAPFYGVYRTSDDKYISLGPLEPQFWAELVKRLGLGDVPSRDDTSAWPELRRRIAAVIATKTRDEWCAVLDDAGVCFAPVMGMAEAPNHPHLASRQTFVSVDGITQPAPAPRFSRTPGAIQGPPRVPGADSRAVLRRFGLTEADIDDLIKSGVVKEQA